MLLTCPIVCSLVDVGHKSETDCVTLILQVVSSVQSGDNFTGFEGPNQLALPVSKILIAHIYVCKCHQYRLVIFYVFCRTVELKSLFIPHPPHKDHVPIVVFRHCTILNMRIPHYHNVYTSRLIILLHTTHYPMTIISKVMTSLTGWPNLQTFHQSGAQFYRMRCETI